MGDSATQLRKFSARRGKKKSTEFLNRSFIANIQNNTFGYVLLSMLLFCKDNPKAELSVMFLVHKHECWGFDPQNPPERCGSQNVFVTALPKADRHAEVPLQAIPYPSAPSLVSPAEQTAPDSVADPASKNLRSMVEDDTQSNRGPLHMRTHASAHTPQEWHQRDSLIIHQRCHAEQLIEPLTSHIALKWQTKDHTLSGSPALPLL